MENKITALLILLCMALILLPASTPRAQDRLLDPNQDFLLGEENSDSEDESNDGRLLEPEPEGDALYQKRAEEFYAECVKNPVVHTNDETDKALCACAATEMYEWLKIPVKRSSDQEFFEVITEKEADTDTLISKIYGPCLHLPIFDIRYDECYYNKRNEYFMVDNTLRHNTCLCTAQAEAEYFEVFAGPYLELKISEGKDILDPVTTIRRSSEYYDHNYSLQASCYKTFLEQ